VDPDGKEGEDWDGDYYNVNGQYLGSDGKDDNKVYIAEQRNSDGSFKNAKELSITHTNFQTISNIIKQEGASRDAEEYLWLAHTSNNEATRRGISMYSLLTSKYSSVSDKTELSTSDNSIRANMTRSAVIDVLLGNPDPTGGATQWDGVDFIIKGTSHRKFKEYRSIHIPLHVLYSHLNKIINSNYYHNGFIRHGGKQYFTPSTDFFKPNYLFSFGFYKQNAVDYHLPELSATGAKGLSIFWKKTY
jgi:hypothetical protein